MPSSDQAFHQRRLDRAIVGGLGVGAAGGIAGTIVAHDGIRQVLWAVDGVGLVVAGALLTLRFLRRHEDRVAAGFLVFTLGEVLLLGGTAAGLAGSVPTFAGGIALWSAALVMTSTRRVFPAWTCAVGLIAALLFGTTALLLFWGVALLPTSVPLPSFAYPILVLTFAGWSWTILHDGSKA